MGEPCEKHQCVDCPDCTWVPLGRLLNLATDYATLQAENAKLREAASEMFDALYRDINVTERGRTTQLEHDLAYQKLGETLGVFGQADQPKHKGG